MLLKDLDHVTPPMSPEAGLQRSSGVHLEASACNDTLAVGDCWSRRSKPLHEPYLCAVCAPKVSTI